MPIFATFKSILELCWQERAVALKFGLIPLAINLALVVAFAEAAGPSFESYATNIAIAASLFVLLCSSAAIAKASDVAPSKSDVADAVACVLCAWNAASAASSSPRCLVRFSDEEA